MTNLSSLERLLAEATEGSRELDARLRIALFDPEVMTDPGDARGKSPAKYERASLVATDEWLARDGHGWAIHVGAKHYTTSLDAALALLGEVLPGWAVCQWHIGLVEMSGLMLVQQDYRRPQIPAEASTPALALCLAIVRALQAQEDSTS